jgi:hypothetical protein
MPFPTEMFSLPFFSLASGGEIFAGIVFIKQHLSKLNLYVKHF